MKKSEIYMRTGRVEYMSERKYDYWTMPLRTATGVAWIDRRDVSGIVETEEETLEVHMKSGTIFTVIDFDESTLNNLKLMFSPYDDRK